MRRGTTYSIVSRSTGNSSESSPNVVTCETPDCYRKDVVTYKFNSEAGRFEVALCLQCRRMIELARHVPWGDESEDWQDTKALELFQERKFAPEPEGPPQK